jgi:hypothetical protein
MCAMTSKQNNLGHRQQWEALKSKGHSSTCPLTTASTIRTAYNTDVAHQGALAYPKLSPRHSRLPAGVRQQKARATMASCNLSKGYL